MKIVYDDSFWFNENDEKSRVFQIFRDKFEDNRGYFEEVLKNESRGVVSETPEWFKDNNWIKQVNRSVSNNNVIRGCHTQIGKFCQGKLVEALTTRIYDIITDARPDSESFGRSNVYILSPSLSNQLWVPRGFLHSVVFSNIPSPAVLQYFCDNVYDKESELGVNPNSVLPRVVENFKTMLKDIETNGIYTDLFDIMESDKKIISEKDAKGVDYVTFMTNVKNEFVNNHKLWYR